MKVDRLHLRKPFVRVCGHCGARCGRVKQSTSDVFVLEKVSLVVQCACTVTRADMKQEQNEQRRSTALSLCLMCLGDRTQDQGPEVRRHNQGTHSHSFAIAAIHRKYGCFF